MNKIVLVLLVIILTIPIVLGMEMLKKESSCKDIEKAWIKNKCNKNPETEICQRLDRMKAFSCSGGTDYSFDCEGNFQPTQHCLYAVDGNWDTFAVAQYNAPVEGETAWVYETYIIPSNAKKAEWTFKLDIQGTLEDALVYYWSYNKNDWTVLKNTTTDGTYTQTIPPDGLTGDVLSIKTKTFWDGVPWITSIKYFEGDVTWFGGRHK